MLFLIILMRIVTAMALLLFLTLKTGRRKISEMPVYDFLTIIVIGSVIGADISEPDVAHLPMSPRSRESSVQNEVKSCAPI